MNTAHPSSTMSREERFGRRLTQRLSESSDQLPHEISERLKAARMMALSKRNVVKVETAESAVRLGASVALPEDALDAPGQYNTPSGETWGPSACIGGGVFSACARAAQPGGRRRVPSGAKPSHKIC